MNEDFVSYEIAVKLKEKGFDEPCYGYYHRDGGDNSFEDGVNYECLSPAHDIYDWLGDIELHPCFTHYLPIPKLEL